MAARRLVLRLLERRGARALGHAARSERSAGEPARRRRDRRARALPRRLRARRGAPPRRESQRLLGVGSAHAVTGTACPRNHFTLAITSSANFRIPSTLLASAPPRIGVP